MITKIVAGIVLICLVTEATAAGEWGYGDRGANPAAWHVDYPLCGGKKQSPINIQTSSMVYLPNLSPLRFTGSPIGGCALTNKGYAIQCTFDSSLSYNVTGGPLSYNYKLGQFHLHYGSVATQGSEHQVNGRSYPAEIHFVFYNSDLFADIGEAYTKPNGLAVIGAFINLYGTYNVQFGKITGNAYRIKYYGNTVHIPNMDVSKLMPHSRYYATYPGSLTTPSCDESATWIVLNSHIHATESQINDLRTQMHIGPPENPGVTMVNNYRPVQPLNARKVFFN